MQAQRPRPNGPVRATWPKTGPADLLKVPMASGSGWDVFGGDSDESDDEAAAQPPLKLEEAEGDGVEGQPCDVVVHIGAGLRLSAADVAADGDASEYALSRLVPGGLLFVEVTLAHGGGGGGGGGGAEDGGGEGRSAALASHFPVDAWALPDAKWQPLPEAADANANANANAGADAVEGEGGPCSARFLVVLRRRGALCNLRACLFKARSAKLAELERAHIETIAVPLSCSERRAGCLTAAHEERAMRCLEEHGVCILPGLLEPAAVISRGAKALQDLADAVEVLKARDGIDLVNPGDKELRHNFYELAMREQCRVDLRNGPRMKRAAARAKATAAATDAARAAAGGEGGGEGEGEGEGEEAAAAAANVANEANVATEEAKSEAVGAGAAADDEGAGEPLLLPRHPAIMAVLDRLMNPRGEHPSGNFGRWNFDGGGPGHQPRLNVGDVGAVIALPGCTDQALHADIYHLLDHMVRWGLNGTVPRNSPH